MTKAVATFNIQICTYDFRQLNIYISRGDEETISIYIVEPNTLAILSYIFIFVSCYTNTFSYRSMATLYFIPTHFLHYGCFEMAAIISSCLKKKTLPFERWNNKYAQAHFDTMRLLNMLYNQVGDILCLFSTTSLSL